MTVSHVDEDEENGEDWDSHKLLLGMQNGVGSLRVVYRFLIKFYILHMTQQSDTQVFTLDKWNHVHTKSPFTVC